MASLIPVPNDDEDSPNDEASESRILAGASQRRRSGTDHLRAGAADRVASPRGTESTADKKENDDAKTEAPVFFRCCQCQHTSKIPACQRPEEKIGVVQAKEQNVLIVNSPCGHLKCVRCINVYEDGHPNQVQCMNSLKDQAPLAVDLAHTNRSYASTWRTQKTHTHRGGATLEYPFIIILCI
ncbi:hypothetical protein EYC84_002384 [Monilinia fructicola]|uniref:Uncharacterized protein n=1 Tax=Monilinia fructicola TaxID=38448 RepID=A0A5M9JMU9_MONFR|nr:hypothetical protein EYC84_002384 [Monilinia fructicola]